MKCDKYHDLFNLTPKQFDQSKKCRTI